MTSPVGSALGALDAHVEKMTSACTRCGDCVRVCPMPAEAGIDAAGAEALIGGVIDLLRGDEASEASERWAAVCSGSGECIAACPEGINPRFLLAMTRRRLTRRTMATARRAKGRASFKAMSRGVRVLSRLQLPPPLLERLSPASHPEREAPPDLVFYTGCNLLKTPHIGLLCLDVLDRIGLSYEVHGGPSACCGILPLRAGDDENALRQSARTRQRLTATGASKMLSWCPTCQMQFAETTLPAQLPASGGRLDMTMFPVFLARRLDALRPHLRRPVSKRVALHEHPGTPGVVESVNALLGAIPGLEVVRLEVPRIGYSLNSLASVPGLAQRLLARELAAAEHARVDCLVSIYHTEHRELAGHAGQWSFAVCNYMELVGESMGIVREDVFKRLKAMSDADEVLGACAPVLEANGLSVEEAREVVAAEILGGQMLPVARETHASYLADPPASSG